MKEVTAKEEQEKKEIDKLMEVYDDPKKNRSIFFNKLWPYNRPLHIVALGVFGNLSIGFA
jgi:hypothetical protein